MIILRQKTFSAKEPEQKEFNSKAAKALNNSYLKKIAAKNEIPIYEPKGFRTIETDWKFKARHINKYGSFAGGKKEKISDIVKFNDSITNKPIGSSASYRPSPFHKDKIRNGSLEEYDHGGTIHTPKSIRKKLVKKAKEQREGK